MRARAAGWMFAPLFALALTGLGATAHAAPPATPAAAPAAAAPTGVMSSDGIAKMSEMTPAQKDAFLKAQAQKIQKMTPKERQAFFAENRKRWAALSPEQKKQLTEKMKKESAEYVAAHKAEWDKNAAEEKKLEDKRTQEFLEKMPGVERAVLQKYKDLRIRGHGRDYSWHVIVQDAASGGKITPVPEGK